VQKVVRELRADPTVTKTVRQVATPTSVAVTAASAGALAVTASTGSAAFALNLNQLIQFLSFSKFYILGLIRFKRRKPWGRIIDKLSGKPLRGATVQIFESEFQKLKDSQITDDEGRFGALVGPGTYYLKIAANGYQGYQSEAVTISSPEQILNLELSLSPIVEEWGLEFVKKINVLNALKRFVELINPYLLALGTLISVISLIIVPNGLNYATFFIYLALDGLKIYFTVHLLKPFGNVINETSSDPLPLTVVRVFDEEKNWLLATKVTDEQGRFNFLLAPGKYYLTCNRDGFLPYRSETLTLEKAGMPTLDIKLKPINQ
jgi:hypothetical protein